MKENFYRGLLCALAEVSDRSYFIASGERYHSAFNQVMEKSKEDRNLPGIEDAFMDPIFGVYPESKEAVIEGLQDLLIGLDTSVPQRAYFRIDKKSAVRELKRLSNPEGYITLAREFLKNN